MGWNKAHKQQTREKILHSAARLFTRKGFDAVGIDDVMQDAGLTRGAFYSHFASKSELYAEAIVSAALAAQQQVVAPLPANPSVGQIAQQYLSPNHKKGLDASCPLAFLTTDIHQRDEQVRAAYTRVFKGFVGAIQQADKNGESARAMQTAVLMIGGLAIARALNDEPLSNQLLNVCLQGICESH